MNVHSVCIVTQQYRLVLSGIGLHARNLLTGLRRDDHRVTLLTQVTQRDNTIPGDVEVLTVPASSLQGSQARWIPLAWHFARKLHQVNAAQCFDIVHFTDAREALWFASHHQAVIGNVNDYYAAQLQPIGYYRRHYADAWKRWLYYVFVHQCERFTLRRLGAIIANSDYTRTAIQRAYQLDHRRLFKCFKCIDLSSFDLSPRTNYSGRLVLFVGGNMQRKGLGTLIRAAPRILAKQPDIRFCIVGQDANLPRIRTLCYQLGIEGYFEFVGWVPNEELRRLYRQASVFVMPSLVEAFGVAFVEAMACGTPVVATRIGGIPELVQHGENGLLVESDNPEELAEALLAVLGDSNLAARLGRNGQCTAQRFGIEQMLACTYRVYESVLGDPL